MTQGKPMLEALIISAQAALEQGDFESAAQMFLRVTEEHPSEPRGWWGLLSAQTRAFTRCAGERENEYLDLFKKAADLSGEGIKREEYKRTFERYASRCDQARTINELEALLKRREHALQRGKATIFVTLLLAAVLLFVALATPALFGWALERIAGMFTLAGGLISAYLFVISIIAHKKYRGRVEETKKALQEARAEYEARGL